MATLPGDYGGTLLADARSGQPRLWPVTDGLNKTRLIVPVRLRRPIESFGRTAEQRCNALPCPPDQSGDRVQFAVRFVPGAGGTPSAPLVSTVGLLGGSDGQDEGGGGGARLLARKPPARIRQARLRRGLTLRVRVPTVATARATLKSGSRVLASASRDARSAGTLTLRLKGRRRALRALGRRTRTARLTVRVNVPGQASQRQTASIRVVP